jgi:hypothetical protein
MGSKRTPQTAAKRSREQALRERRAAKQEKRDAATAARKETTEQPGDDPDATAPAAHPD